MADLKHTPGPWHFSEMWRPTIGRRHESDRHNAKGEVFHGYSIAGSMLPTLAAVHNFPDQREANARLISKAPEMAELVEKLATWADLAERNDGFGDGEIVYASMSTDCEVKFTLGELKAARALYAFIKGDA